MTILIILVCAVLLVYLVLLLRDRAVRPDDEDAVAPVEDFVSAPIRRRRPVRDSLVGLLDHAGNSWRLYKDERASKAASGEIVSPAKLAPKDSRRITLRTLPPPPRNT